jgi:uncharacterized membrane protein YhiD involved in acid resistance
MPITLTWQAITLRLVLTILCAGILGFDRDERGRTAGLRTNLLVGLAAGVAMRPTRAKTRRECLSSSSNRSWLEARMG